MAQITQIPNSIEYKTKEQQKIITRFFFYEKGCRNKQMSVPEYLKLLEKKRTELNVREKGLKKIGIEAQDIAKFSPIEISGFSYDGDFMLNGTYSSQYTTTWLFFGETIMYVYAYVFDMTSDSYSERLEEYYYHDITKFSVASESKEIFSVAQKGCRKTEYVSKGSIDTSKLELVVPGDKFTCALKPTAEVDEAIKAVKNKIHELK